MNYETIRNIAKKIAMKTGTHTQVPVPMTSFELSDWKYRALRATLPSNNVNVIWLERNVWRGNDKGIRQCQQFVIRSTSGRLACPRITRTLSVAVIRWKTTPPCVTVSDD